ncbi:MAG: FecR family protein [Candidatus Tantalella remota]|nr:FecR family protein [Candidatus Tantalella remota]
MKRRAAVIVLGMFLCAVCSVSMVYASAEMTVISYSGDVKIIQAGQKEEVVCRSGMSLKKGDAIRTGKDSSVGILVGGEMNIVSIHQNSNVVLVPGRGESIELLDGELLVSIKDFEEKSEFSIKTPFAVCGARGTGWVVWTDGKFSEVTVFDGEIYFKGLGAKKEYIVKKGKKRKIDPSGLAGEEVNVSPGDIWDMIKNIAILEKLAGIDGQGGIKAQSSFRDEKRMSMMERKMEGAERRMSSVVDIGGGVTPLPGRGDDDDERRNTRRGR